MLEVDVLPYQLLEFVDWHDCVVSIEAGTLMPDTIISIMQRYMRSLPAKEAKSILNDCPKLNEVS